MAAKPSKKLSTKEYLRAVWNVAKLSYRIAPGAIGFKLIGVVVDAALPIATTFLAAATTTELVAAFNGDTTAGEKAIFYVIATAILGLLMIAWNSVGQYVNEFVRYRVEAKVSDKMYEHFLTLDFWRYDDKATADLYDKAQKFSQFFAYIFDRLGSVLSEFITLIFSLVALFIFLPWIALLVLIGVIPGMIIQFKLSRVQIAHWNKNVDLRRSRSYIEWNLLRPEAIAELRLNGVVRHLLNIRQDFRDRDEKQRLQYERDYIGIRLWADALEAFIEVGALIWVVTQIIARQMPVGQFVYTQQMVSRALGSANSFVRQLSTIDEDLAHLHDYEEFMNLPRREEGTITPVAIPAEITFKDVSFRYPNSEVDVLKNINLTIKRGSHVAIVGENGAGKSTFIKLFTGLYEPTKGSVLLDTLPLNDVSLGWWHRSMTVLQQDFQRYVFTTVKNNVYFGDVSKPLDNERLSQALKEAEADEFTDKLPQKLNTIPIVWMEDEDGNKGVALSGGQWQRLALARSFYRDAPIIILDEPTSAIDALAEARVFKRLFKKDNPKTVVTISHRLSTVEKADVIIMLEDGKIVETGTHQELVGKRGKYYAMFQSQIER